jgi:hypothetical protein
MYPKVFMVLSFGDEYLLQEMKKEVHRPNRSKKYQKFKKIS